MIAPTDPPGRRGRAYRSLLVEPIRVLRRRTGSVPDLAVRLGIALAVVEITLLGATAAAALLFGSDVPAFDSSVAQWVQSLETPALTLLFTGLTLIGYVPANTVVVLFVLRQLAASRRPILAWTFLLTMLGEPFLEYATKLLVHRPRPDLFQLADATGYAFPSGHALAATCLYGYVLGAFWPRCRGWRQRLGLGIIGTALPIGIGLSRVYLGVHYPSDVLAGWLCGLAWLLAVWVAVIRRPRRLVAT